MSQEHADIGYLKSDQVGKVVAMGLAELYRAKPEFPVDFLAKWLHNYSDQQRAMQRVQAEKQAKAELLGDIHRQKLQREERRNQELLAAEEAKRRVHRFESEVAEAEYHDELVADFLPNEVMKLVEGLTAVYVGWFEMQRKPVDLAENDDELAHFDMSKPKLIQYIGGDEHVRVGAAHQAKAKTWVLPEGRGVTYEVFAEPDPATQPASPDGPDDDEAEKEPAAKFKHVPDVVSEPNMHYFEIPRLGAYLAVPMIVKSYLNVESFDDAITKLQVYEEQAAKAREERARVEKEFEERIAKAKENDENVDEIINEYKETKFEEVAFPDFAHEVKKYVLCADTLGRDRDFTPEQIQTIVGHASHFVKEWQNKELAYLQEDVRRFGEYENSFENVADVIHELAEREEREAISRATGFGDLPEAKLNFKSDEVRLQVVKEQLLNKDLCLKHLLGLASYRVVKFPRILQNAFYLAGYKKEDINEPGSNVLNWRKVRQALFTEEFVSKLLAYEYAGPKAATVERYAGVNRINRRVNEIGRPR